MKIEEAILEHCAARGADKSISPDEIARALTQEGEHWSKYSAPIRAAAVGLARAGKIEILRKGQPVDPNGFKGVYRLRIVAHMGGDGHEA
jgi:hypothetical protein